MSFGIWRPPPETLRLGLGDVHVWQASLDLPSGRAADFTSTLANDELDRAGRFHFEKDRQSYIVSRGVLRVLLGRYLKQDPEKVCLNYGPNGKPEVAGYGTDHTLQFNLAHSDRIALYAFTEGRPIGIDVEKMRPLEDADGLASRYFSAREYAAWRTVDQEERQIMFFRYWTSKEAYIKAIGAGLSFPLDQFDVSLAPGEPASLLTISGDEEKARRWSLRELHPAEEYAAAVSAPGPWRLNRWRWA